MEMLNTCCLQDRLSRVGVFDVISARFATQFPESQENFLALLSELRAEGGVDHDIGGRVDGDKERVDVKQLQPRLSDGKI